MSSLHFASGAIFLDNTIATLDIAPSKQTPTTEISLKKLYSSKETEGGGCENLSNNVDVVCFGSAVFR